MRKSVFTTVMAAVFAVMAMAAAFAGSLDAPVGGDPTVSGGPGAMFTLEDVYQRLLNGATATKRVGPFAEPGAGPTAGTGHTLDDVYNLIGTRAFVPKTGQTGCWNAGGTAVACSGTGQDGEKLKGVSSPTPRFTDNSNGTVTDNLTGLIWLKNANCTDTISGINPTTSSNKLTWQNALTWTAGLASGACGLSDSSTAGQWRLPNRFELESLLDLQNANPALPAGYAIFFINVQTYPYWSATTYADSTTNTWYVSLHDGYVGYLDKSVTRYVWPVR